jgi:hypothetical protein
MKLLQNCPCGSGEFPNAKHDARGIFVAYVCHKCEREKLKGYRPEIFTNPSYEYDEQIEEDY